MSAAVYGMSPREEVIVMLAEGDLPNYIAARMGTSKADVEKVGKAYGYPQNRAKIKAVARLLRDGDRGENLEHAGAVYGCPWKRPGAGVPEMPEAPAAEEAAVVTGTETAGEVPVVDEPEPIPDPEPIPLPEPAPQPEPTATDAVSVADAAEILGILDRAASAPFHRAVLRMPLGRLVSADGTETVIGNAVVEVELHPAGVLAALHGDADGPPPVTTFVSTEMTTEGAAAIRALATQLPGGVAP